MSEVKGTLAKLLAQEDLIVENRNVQTAQFNVDTRVLTLPNWNKAPEHVTDLLISHEVGHALYTPTERFHYTCPHSYINVVEDIRIEKLMKRRYAGLSKTFYKGYQQFAEDDFFEVADTDVSKMNIIDRLNIFFKIGNFFDVSFSSVEKKFIDQANRLEGFQDVIDLAEAIYKYYREEEDRPSQTPTENLPQQQSGQASSQAPNQANQDIDDGEGESTDESQSQETESTTTDGEIPQGGTGHAEDHEAVTDSLLREKLQNLVDSSSPEINYVERPVFELDKVVIDYTKLNDYTEDYFGDHGLRVESNEYINSFWDKFKKDSAREVNYLVKEFECKKAASAYARSHTSRTGVLDTNKLHTYKFNDDIFRKINIVPDGKNHGLIFNLDWSGSMQDVLLDTVKQLLCLTMFCRKVGIPYDVYIFTNEWYNSDTTMFAPMKAGTLVAQGFALVNVLSSRAKTKEQDLLAHRLFSYAWAFTNRQYGVGIPSKMYLSGTPLNEALLVQHQLIKQFQQRSKAEKVHVVVLTDGEGCPLMRWQNYETDKGFDRVVRRTCHQTRLRDRKTGRVYPIFTGGYYAGDNQTEVLVQNLQENFPQCNFINIRLCSTSDFTSVKRYYLPTFEERVKAETQWKKEKCYIGKTSNYSRSLFIHSKSISDSGNSFEVAEDASKAQIRSAFKKALGNRKTSKRILSEFITMIA
jgi:hypothetical protein